MEKIELEYNFDGSVAKITLNSAKGNVLDSIMMRDLHTAFKMIKENRNVKLITFEGYGKHFSFGASVEEHTKDKAAEMLSGFHSLFYELIELSIPTIAKISGQCLGGGLELAMMCNLLFADKTAKLGQPEIILGVFAPVASLILPYKIGSNRADELLITGKIISAGEAKEIGLINEVFEDKDTMENALNEWIETNILSKSASSLRFAVKTARRLLNSLITEELPKLEELYIRELMETEDANEGINAFLEKRQPVWKNK